MDSQQGSVKNTEESLAPSTDSPEIVLEEVAVACRVILGRINQIERRLGTADLDAPIPDAKAEKSQNREHIIGERRNSPTRQRGTHVGRNTLSRDELFRE